MKKFSLSFRATVFVFALTSLFSSNTYAAIINGSFEDGLTGFYKNYGNGEVEVYQTLGNESINPTHGNHFLYVSIGPADVGTDGQGDKISVESDAFRIESGMTTLTLDFNVLTEQNTPSSWFSDIGHIYFGGTNYIAYVTTMSNYVRYRNDIEHFGHWQNDYDAFYPIGTDIYTPNGAHYTKQTGWYRVILDVSELSGMGIDHLLNFSMWEASYSELYDTALLIDNIRLNPVPIPSSMLLFGSGLVSFIAIRRKRGKICMA